MKVHKKVGVTLNIKGLVGMNTNKNYVIHYKLGTPSQGGDQFPDDILTAKESMKVKSQRWAYDKLLSRKNPTTDFLYDTAARLGKIFLKPLGFRLDKEKSHLDDGNWHGNDSAWRMSIDLLRILIYGDNQGNLSSVPVRRMFLIVDGVIGGEGNGPLTPNSKKCGLIIAGFNPCAVDVVCTRLMGFDCRKVKTLSYILTHSELFNIGLPKIKILSNRNFDNLFDARNDNKYFDFFATSWLEGLY